MGGVLAIYNRKGEPVNGLLMAAMAKRGAYRGPDGFNYWISGEVGVGHLALNTTPESHRESQPLISKGGNVVLAADVRIDNRSELIDKLRDVFIGKDVVTDVDIILEAYNKWGCDCPRFLIGDFAFVLWDKSKSILLAVRDAMGIRPLHYAWIGDDFCVATEAQQMLVHPKAKSKVSELALTMWLIDRFDDSLSMFEGIARLPAGHMLVLNRTCLRVQRYWDIDPESRIEYRNPKDYSDHLREIICRCVSDRLRSDSLVIGSHMSGGMDSTSVTSCAHHILRNSDKRLAVFSWQFNTLTTCDETPYVRAIEKFLDFRVNSVDAERYWILDDISQYAPPLEFPGGHGFDSIYHAMLKGLSDMGGRVMLTGHGGDDMTAGSPLTYMQRFWRGNFKLALDIARVDWKIGHPIAQDLYSALLSPILPRKLKRMLRLIFRTNKKTESPWPNWISDSAGNRLQLKERFYSSKPCRFSDRARQAIYERVTGSHIAVSVHWHERLAASYGIDVRHPFIDRRLAEFAVAIPPFLWNDKLFPKYLLRASMKGMLPDKVRWRRDKPDFWAYWAKGLQGERGKVERFLSAEYPEEKEILVQRNLMEEYCEYLDSTPDLANPRIFSPLMLKLWLNTHRQTFLA